MTEVDRRQIFALLFQQNGSVAAAVQPGLPGTDLKVANTEAGLSSLLDWMTRHFDRSCEPLLCCSAAPGASVGGLILQELVASDQVRRFMMAQPFYLHCAEASGQDPHVPATLLKAATDHAPRISGAA